MNPARIVVRPDADQDAEDYFLYLDERNPDAAARLLLAIDETLKGLAIQPLKGRLRRFHSRKLRNIRSWRVDGFENYLIFYRHTAGTLEVLRIRHGAMKFPKALLGG